MKTSVSGSERYSFSAVGSTSSKRMQIVSTLPALSKAPTVPFFTVLPVKFPMCPAKESPKWFLCWIHGGTDYQHRLWVSWGSSLKSWEEGLNTTQHLYRFVIIIVDLLHFTFFNLNKYRSIDIKINHIVMSKIECFRTFCTILPALKIVFVPMYPHWLMWIHGNGANIKSGNLLEYWLVSFEQMNIIMIINDSRSDHIEKQKYYFLLISNS